MKHLTLIGLIMCASIVDALATTSPVFKHPQSFLGKQVEVCGFVHFALEDTNLWPDERSQKHNLDGLGILYEGTDRSLYELNGKIGCISGRVVETGCKSDERKICNWSDHDFAIRVFKK